ncbi:MAG: hypothetical protein WC374_13945 [Phycisphaerae bacterium]
MDDELKKSQIDFFEWIEKEFKERLTRAYFAGCAAQSINDKEAIANFFVCASCEDQGKCDPHNTGHHAKCELFIHSVFLVDKLIAELAAAAIVEKP